MSKIEVNAVEPQSGTTLTIGASGDTVALAAGATSTGFGETYNGAVNWDTTIKTSGFTAVSGIGYFCDTTGGAFTVTLPASPSPGNVVGIKDAGSYAGTNAITIARNGSNIENNASNAFINIHGSSTTLLYADASRGWLVVDSGTVFDFQQPEFVAATGGTVTTCGNCKVHTFTGPGSFVVTSGGNDLGSNSVNYLIVAGGGAGGQGKAGNGGGSGGGAGGFRESRSPGSPWTASPLASTTSLPVTAQTYPITVGAGGGPGSGCGTPGSPSIFSTITSAGGGGGGGGQSPDDGSPGGSGAGRNLGNTPPVSPPQGQDGGLPAGGSAPGGGGAGEQGAQGQGSSGNYGLGGRGGAGVTTSISGSSTAYAGGGGGGGYAGGPGGFPNAGGAGSPCGTGGRGNPVANGTTNRGGGGGGNGGGDGSSNAPHGLGGSGIVVIRYKFQ
jgi:hypothetical protein